MDLTANYVTVKGKAAFHASHGPPTQCQHSLGTAFNKILKDFNPLKDTSVNVRLPGPLHPRRDTHGLPIELRVLKEEGATKESMDPVVLRSKCTDYARRYIDIQREEFKRLGVLGDWDNPYLTYKPE